LPEVPKFVWLIAALVGAGIVVGGVVWLTDGGSTSSEEKAQLEASIQHRLPRELKRIGVDRASARRVNCVSSAGDRYECIARVHRGGQAGTVAMLIDATCGGGECVWHSVANGAQEELKGPDPAAVRKVLQEERQAAGKGAPAMGEPRYGWSTVTCGEVEEATAGREVAWLEAAGSAVAEQEIARRPDGDQEKLVIEGVHDLAVACSTATNPGYQPYERAVLALASGGRP
jgi:hypothetical protein